jgi:hypothetical protein
LYLWISNTQGPSTISHYTYELVISGIWWAEGQGEGSRGEEGGAEVKGNFIYHI